MVYKVVNTKIVREARLDEDLVELEKIQNKILDPDFVPPDPDDVPQNLENPQDKTDWKKRHSDLRSFTQKEINELKKELNTVRSQLTDATQKQIKFPKTEEEVTDWVQKYPDVAAIVETIAMKKVADVRKEMADRDTVLQEQAYQVEFNKNLNRIVAVHSDFFELRENDDFIEWLQKQPKYVRLAFADNPVDFDDLEDIADTVISALKLYKAEKPKKNKNDDNRDAARGILNKGSGGVPQERPENTILESDIDKMSIKEYEKREEEIMKAMREGRIIYDLPRAGR
jgi:hypothetical protein